MPTAPRDSSPNVDRRRLELAALLFLSLLLLAGCAVKWWLSRRSEPRIGVVHAAAGAAYRVDINAAGADELQLLPGIGPARAAKIVAHRARRGSFGSVDELAAVPGCPAKCVEGLRPYATCSTPARLAP